MLHIGIRRFLEIPIEGQSLFQIICTTDFYIVFYCSASIFVFYPLGAISRSGADLSLVAALGFACKHRACCLGSPWTGYWSLCLKITRTLICRLNDSARSSVTCG